jgi:hypothetical protein
MACGPGVPHDKLTALQFLEDDGVDIQKLDASLNRYAIKLMNIHFLNENFYVTTEKLLSIVPSSKRTK